MPNANLTYFHLLANTSLNGASACLVEVSRTGLKLLNDTGNSYLAESLFGSGQTLQNSQCRVDPRSAGFAVQGTTWTFFIPITPMPHFRGEKKLYLEINNTAQYTQAGLFGFTPQPGQPSVQTLTPTSGAGATARFTGVFSHQEVSIRSISSTF